MGIQTSPDTLIRLLIAASEIDVKAPKHLGVDDFAFRRGMEYGALLVDLDTGQAVDVLKDRAGETFNDWLLAHPDAETVSRDCSQAYADAIRREAPDATQVADRFHLAKNLTEALKKQLRREQSALDRAARGPEPEGDPAVSGVETPTGIPSGPDTETSAADSPLRTEAYVVPGKKLGAKRSGIRELVTFARGLKRDWAAVKAAFTQPWSNGVVEGNVNRLKMIKRAMFGRGCLALLRARVLLLA